MNVSPAGSGNITSPSWSANPTSYPTTYTCSQIYVLTAVPSNAAQYQFDHWEGSYTGSSNPLTVDIIDGAKSVTACFKLITEDISAPSSLSARAKSSTQAVIGWKDNSDNETGFKIESKADGCDSDNTWEEIATASAGITSYTISDLLPNTNYAFRVKAYNDSADSPYSNCTTAKTGPSGSPPSPSNLKATSASATKVNLSWTDNSTEDGFKIYRKAGTGAWTLLKTTAKNSKSFSDTTAANNSSKTAYQYYVVAYNASGSSPSTNTASVPFMPISLTAAQGTTAGAVTLNWMDKSTNESGFEIYRKTGGCSSTSTWSKVASVGANKKTWTDTGRTSGSVYSYQIRAYTKTGSVLSSYGYSMYGNCDDATAP